MKLDFGLPSIATTSSSWMTSREPETTKQRVSTLSPMWKMRSPAPCMLFQRSGSKVREERRVVTEELEAKAGSGSSDTEAIEYLQPTIIIATEKIFSPSVAGAMLPNPMVGQLVEPAVGLNGVGGLIDDLIVPDAVPDAGQPVGHQAEDAHQQDQDGRSILQVVVQLTGHPAQSEQADHLEGAEQTAETLQREINRQEILYMHLELKLLTSASLDGLWLTSVLSGANCCARLRLLLSARWNSPLERRTIFSRKVFCGATSPLLPPCMMRVPGRDSELLSGRAVVNQYPPQLAPDPSVDHKCQNNNNDMRYFRAEVLEINAECVMLS
ncbi:hypothetical protein EYF80_007186 [Liparis tanakae]|uniref:Uncharacterized protein n=1 Tax=Liparis tanakae TaxID=230148 RepID=A0A4Z2IYU0_9TELE|nr:hypothetical protein EYF80_007186 [Liparis tanakae]